MVHDDDDAMSVLTGPSANVAKMRREGAVCFKDWFIVHVGGFLSFPELCRWDTAMSSQRQKWLQALSNVKIAVIDKFDHNCNESIRWLISRRIQCVTTIIFSGKYYYRHRSNDICDKTFTNAGILSNLKSFVVTKCITDSVLTSIKRNCRQLEEVHVICDEVGDSLSFAAAADMVQKLPRLRCFTYSREEYFMKVVADGSPIKQSSSPLLLSLAHYCPLLESLNLAKYNDEGLAELVAGCPKLHTLTINADTNELSVAGYRALGKSRSITTLKVNTYVIDKMDEALRTMADEGMPIKTIELYTSSGVDLSSQWRAETTIVRFASTLENLKIWNLAEISDNNLIVLSQCHQLRSIKIENFHPDEYNLPYGAVTGAFLNAIGVGCPLLEEVFINDIIHSHDPDDQDDPPFFETVNFTPFF